MLEVGAIKINGIEQQAQQLERGVDSLKIEDMNKVNNLYMESLKMKLALLD